jgi:hypothetical protein
MTLAGLSRASHVELRYAFGLRIVAEVAAYLDMPEEALANVLARPLSRRELVADLARRRRRRGS